MLVFIAFLLSVAVYGYSTSAPYNWIAILAAASSIVYLPCHNWVASDRLGAMMSLSAVLKFVLSIIGLISTVTGWMTIALAAYWAFDAARSAI